ncbi:hypothetical protein LA080_012210 [Diaporthe eres]|nr:hypothetical protein LA080_012210 [Diaporthe eres]
MTEFFGHLASVVLVWQGDQRQPLCDELGGYPEMSEGLGGDEESATQLNWRAQARLLVLIQGPRDNAVPYPSRQKQTAWLAGWSKSTSPVQAISELDEISKGMETTRDAPHLAGAASQNRLEGQEGRD